MNRRDILKGIMAITALSTLRPPLQAAVPGKYIVIGAGMAGLAAAKTLSQAGHQVTLLEGRERLGGRTWTSEQWPDAPVDLGASWIHGVEGNPLTELAKQAEATLITTSYDSSTLYDSTGSEADDALIARLNRLRGEVERG